MSRMTVVVDADGDLIEQVTKQLNKLINVIKIVELTPESSVQRDHILVKVRADAATRLQVTQAADLFRASVVDVSTDSVVIEATGHPEKLTALLSVLEPFGIREIVQSGTLAIGRGSRSMSDRHYAPRKAQRKGPSGPGPARGAAPARNRSNRRFTPENPLKRSYASD
ncbi:acetolactate synthase small subunit [Arthrobacter sp. Hiyo6]|nr:acetolactate synthase small subunit [Arthrobacter sp. Hiyo6]